MRSHIFLCSGSLQLRVCKNFEDVFLMGTQPVSIRRPGEVPPFPYFRVRELLSAGKIPTVSKLQEIVKEEK